MPIPSLIQQLANDIRTKIYGKDVRESLAKGIEESGKIAEEANTRSIETESRQDDIEQRWDEQIQNMTLEDPSSAEIVDARGGEPLLRNRLDKVDAQLAETMNGVVNVKAFGALGDGSNDDTQAFKDAISYINTINPIGVHSAGVTLYCPSGTYIISDELDFTNTKVPVTLEGSGSASTTIKAANNFGQDKIMLNFNRTKSSRLEKHGGFRKISIEGALSDYDPILISRLYCTTTKNYDFITRRNNNIHYVGCSEYNVEYNSFQIMNNSYNKNLEKVLNDTVTFTVNLGQNTVVASENVFDPTDVGKDFMVYATGGVERKTIDSYISPNTVTVSSNFNRTGSNVKGSFCPVTVTGTTGSNTVTLSSPIAHPSMIGRYVIIPKAKNGKASLWAKVTDASTDQLTLSTALGANITNEDLLFGAGFMLLNNTLDLSENDEDTNDVQLSQGRIEALGSTCLFVSSCAHVSFNQVKIHGNVRYNNFGSVDYLAVLDSFKDISFDNNGWVHGYNPKGRIRILGSAHSFNLSNFTVMNNETLHNNFIYAPSSDLDFSSFGAKFSLNIGAGTIFGNATSNNFKFSNADIDKIYAPFPINTPNGKVYLTRMTAQSFRSHSENITLLDGGVISVPTYQDNGFLIIVDQNHDRSGMIYFGSTGVTKIHNSSQNTLLNAINNTKLTGSTGLSGKMNISYVSSDLTIYIENRTGTASYLRYVLIN